MDWQDEAELAAVVLIGFGFAFRTVCELTGVHFQRLRNMCEKVKVGPTQYRELKKRDGKPTLGRQVATAVIDELSTRYQTWIRQQLPEPGRRPRNVRLPSGTIPSTSNRQLVPMR